MVAKPKETSLQSKNPTAIQKISAALHTTTDVLNLYETISDEQLRKVISHIVQSKKLSPSELKIQFIDSLVNLEKKTNELEIYKEALIKIKNALEAEKTKPKGGRPKNKWAIQAFECAKNYQQKKGKLPSAETLKRLVSTIAETGGYFGESNSDGEFPLETAKQYLNYFKNNLSMFIALDANNWFDLYEGRYHWTKL